MINVTPPVRKSTFLIQGRGLILFVALFVALACLISFKSHAESYTRYSAFPGAPLSITAAPGQEISVTITAGPSLNGFWYSTGLNITLDSPASFSAQVVVPHDDNWGSLFQTSKDTPNEDIVMDGSFTVPTPGTAGMSVLRGKISGGLTYPISYDVAYFRDQVTSLSIPVIIQLISPSTAFIWEQLPLYLAGSSSILILLAIPVFYRIYKVKRKRLGF
jgi:hypothetical protein